jgi:hypothetical protein
VEEYQAHEQPIEKLPSFQHLADLVLSRPWPLQVRPKAAVHSRDRKLLAERYGDVVGFHGNLKRLQRNHVNYSLDLFPFVIHDLLINYSWNFQLSIDQAMNILQFSTMTDLTVKFRCILEMGDESRYVNPIHCQCNNFAFYHRRR